MTPRIAIVGATATGKSALAVDMAKALTGEVVNADSMQLYQGMDIGTAKVTAKERAGVPHHLLDIWPVTRTATLSEYQALALTELDRLRAKATASVLVGGSGMYVQAVVDRWTIPGTDPAIRRRLEAEARENGLAVLHQRLAAVDPAAAETIQPTDSRRIVRALEVVELQGTFAARLPVRSEYSDHVLIGLEIAREELDDRIAERVNRMWKRGLVAEVDSLVSRGLRQGRTASRALGYAQILQFLAGGCTEQEAKQGTIRATRKFARRQDSWFRRDQRVTWLPYDATNVLDQALDVATMPR